jgi:hypothetical protein
MTSLLHDQQLANRKWQMVTSHVAEIAYLSAWISSHVSAQKLDYVSATHKKFSCKSVNRRLVFVTMKMVHWLLIRNVKTINLLQRAFVSNYSVDIGRLPSSSKHASGNLSRIYWLPAFYVELLRNSKLKRKVVLTAFHQPFSLIVVIRDEMCYPLSLVEIIEYSNFQESQPMRSHKLSPISFNATKVKLIGNYNQISVGSISFQQWSYIDKCQHAFITNHSTTINLLKCKLVNDWLVSIKSPSRTDVVCIDVS